MSRLLSRQARPLWIGLAASSLLHTALLTSDLIVLPAAWENMDAPPIEARLELPPPTPPLSETAAPRQPKAKAKPVARPRRVVAQVEPAPSFSPEVAAPESPVRRSTRALVFTRSCSPGIARHAGRTRATRPALGTDGGSHSARRASHGCASSA